MIVEPQTTKCKNCFIIPKQHKCMKSSGIHETSSRPDISNNGDTLTPLHDSLHLNATQIIHRCATEQSPQEN